jgi:CrcB protein
VTFPFIRGIDSLPINLDLGTIVVQNFVIISLGAVLGANARYLICQLAIDRWGNTFPFGTLLVNTTGSFLIGFFVILATQRIPALQSLHLPLVVGFLGAYTTFSALSFEFLTLVESRQYALAALSLSGNVLLGTIAVAAGFALARALP